MEEGAKLIAQAFMKEKALIYSKSFTSPLWMWSDERSGAREKGRRDLVVGTGTAHGSATKFTRSILDKLIGKLDCGQICIYCLGNNY